LLLTIPDSTHVVNFASKRICLKEMDINSRTLTKQESKEVCLNAAKWQTQRHHIKPRGTCRRNNQGRTNEEKMTAETYIMTMRSKNGSRNLRKTRKENPL
jgi:hypothetical protein